MRALAALVWAVCVVLLSAAVVEAGHGRCGHRGRPAVGYCPPVASYWSPPAACVPGAVYSPPAPYSPPAIVPGDGPAPVAPADGPAAPAAPAPLTPSPADLPEQDE